MDLESTQVLSEALEVLAQSVEKMALGAQQLLILLAFASVAIDVVHGCGINIRNNCGYTVTTCAQDDKTPIAQYNLGSGLTQFLDFGSACIWIEGAIWASVGGQCAVSGNPVAAVDRNRANLAEFTINSTGDTYDLSNVNAYTIGLSISVTQAVGGACGSPICVINDIRSFCQPDNVLQTVSTGALVCINTDGPGNVPTAGTRQFKTACPDAYSYSGDDPTSTYPCDNGSDYEVTFCPANGLVSEK